MYLLLVNTNLNTISTNRRDWNTARAGNFFSNGEKEHDAIMSKLNLNLM